jgi:predicted 3-demethylubiquinone-9 3-methyltransferase (glyoxalase superfamily)
MPIAQKITPNLWFNNNAEEAVNFYVSVFSQREGVSKNSQVEKISRYGKEGFEVHGQKEGTVLTIEFQLAGQSFVALNGGPDFKFNEAISFIINCEWQEEVDYYWEKLSEGGDEKAQVCGWLKDKFGISWQIIPTILPEMLTDSDAEKSQRVMKEVFKMKKLDIATLERAYNGVL